MNLGFAVFPVIMTINLCGAIMQITIMAYAWVLRI